jgi:hypothetical protein
VWRLAAYSAEAGGRAIVMPHRLHVVVACTVVVVQYTAKKALNKFKKTTAKKV